MSEIILDLRAKIEVLEHNKEKVSIITKESLIRDNNTEYYG